MHGQPEQKNMGLEILRILAMTGITLIHIVNCVNFTASPEISLPNWGILLLLKILSRGSVIVFSLLTGYFLCEKPFRFSRITSVWATTFCVSALIMVLMRLLGTVPGPVNILKCLFPLLTAHYWYIFTYVVLLAASPAVNKGLACLNQYQHRALCIGAGLFLCIWLELNPMISAATYAGSSFGFIWMLYLYVVGAYIRKYDISKKAVNITFAVSVLLTAGLFLFSWFFDEKLAGIYRTFNMKSLFLTQFSKSNNILPLMMSVCFFCWFKNLRLKQNRFICYVSSFSLYVYLFQQHCLISPVLWKKMDITRYLTSPFLFLFIIWQLLVVWGCSFLLFSVVKYLRKPVLHAVNSLSDRILRRFSRLRSH